MARTSAITRSLAVATTVAAVVAVPAGAQASGHRGTEQLDCSGLGTVTITTPPENVGDSWSAAQIVGDGHLVPVSFTYLAEDTTLGVVLNQFTESHGPAHQQQDTITCSTTLLVTLADLLPAPPGVELPPGVQPTDTVALTFLATVVPHLDQR